MNHRILIPTDEDLIQILDIWKTSLSMYYPKIENMDELIEIFEANFRNRKFPHEYWVAKSESTVLGWASILPIFMQPLKKKTDAEISVYIDHLYSKKGIGTELATHVLNEISKSGIQNVWAFVPLANINSRTMCENARMKSCGNTTTKIVYIKEYP